MLYYFDRRLLVNLKMYKTCVLLKLVQLFFFFWVSLYDFPLCFLWCRRFLLKNGETKKPQLWDNSWGWERVRLGGNGMCMWEREIFCIKLHVQGSFHRGFTGPLTVAVGPTWKGGEKNCGWPPSCVLPGRGLFCTCSSTQIFFKENCCHVCKVGEEWDC